MLKVAPVRIFPAGAFGVQNAIAFCERACQQENVFEWRSVSIEWTPASRIQISDVNWLFLLINQETFTDNLAALRITTAGPTPARAPQPKPGIPVAGHRAADLSLGR